MRTDVDADLEEMETEASERAAVAAEEVNEAEKFTMMKLLKSAELRMPVIIMVVLQVAQQFSGINAVGRLLKCCDSSTCSDVCNCFYFRFRSSSSRRPSSSRPV